VTISKASKANGRNVSSWMSCLRVAVAGLLQSAAAHAFALCDTELCGLHAAGDRFLHAMRHVVVVSNSVFFDPGRATHMASSASRS
jgi:hypothetical protein